MEDSRFLDQRGLVASRAFSQGLKNEYLYLNMSNVIEVYSFGWGRLKNESVYFD